VIYELHVGAFTAEGTFDGAAGELERLRALGVGAVELMPVAEFPGERGWGYDGVYPSAAHHAYGGPAALQRFVDAAHASGIAVILDVVYNHVGTSGTAAIEAFGPYLTDRYRTLWGNAVNFDGAGSDVVREWAIQSALGWLRDFRIDGLRLDAVHAIFDQRPRHVVGELCDRVHAAHPGARVIAESALNDPRVIRPPAQAGWGCDAQWADDFHHALHALLTGERDGYYAEFGAVADLAKAFVRPYVRDGD
jgi:maltooligosyltrehalose trehalohydrolase